jgi:hypothetical protein
MATQTVEFAASPDQTITARLFSPGSDTVVQTASEVDEATNRDGVYSATFTDAAAGVYRLIATNAGGTPLAQWWVDLTLTTATFQSYEMPVSVMQSGLSTFDAGSDTVTVGSASRDAIVADFLAHVISKGGAGTIERAFWQAAKSQASAEGEVSGTPTVSAFDTDLTAVTGAFDDLLIRFVSGSLEGEARPIATYSSTDGRITLQKPLTAAPSAADEFLIIPDHSHSIADIQSGLATDSKLSSAYDLVAWLLTAAVGNISNAQTAAESFELILGGVTYTVTGSGMTESGNRGTTTLSKV